MDKHDSTYTLRIEDIQETDGAIYQCQVIISLTDKEIADVPLIVRRPPVISDNSTRHSAQKLEKSAISKVQKKLFCYFKNGKKSIFAPEKSPKKAFLIFLNCFLVQKLIFLPFLK